MPRRCICLRSRRIFSLEEEEDEEVLEEEERPEEEFEVPEEEVEELGRLGFDLAGLVEFCLDLDLGGRPRFFLDFEAETLEVEEEELEDEEFGEPDFWEDFIERFLFFLFFFSFLAVAELPGSLDFYSPFFFFPPLSMLLPDSSVLLVYDDSSPPSYLLKFYSF